MNKIKIDDYAGLAAEFKKHIESTYHFRSIIEAISKATKSYDFIKTIEPLHLEMEKISGSLFDLPSLNIADFPAVQWAREANLAITRLSDSLLTINLPDSFSATRDYWKKELSISSSALVKSIEDVTLGIHADLSKLSELTLFSERSLSLINIGNIGTQLELQSLDKNRLFESQRSLSESFAALYNHYLNPNLSAFNYPPFAITQPAKEYFLDSRIIRAISIHREVIEEDEEQLYVDLSKETSESIEGHLNSVDPALIPLWQGAISDLNLSGPDSGRHFSVSLRELLTHVIHFLAPDEAISQWTKDRNHFDKDGHPTRRTRILYICRNINLVKLERFISKDIDSILAFFDILQEGTHTLNTCFPEYLPELILARARSLLVFLIKTNMGSNRN